MRWAGFRKVRGQVCKRIRRRMRELELSDGDAYRDYLEKHPPEWQVLEPLCRVTISRFYRDRSVWECIGQKVLPALAQRAVDHEDNAIRCWSAGCGSGEEPYSLACIWNFLVKRDFPEIELHITATDADPALLKRAEAACFSKSSLKELPESWLDRGFNASENRYTLKPELQKNIHFLEQDIRTTAPPGPFHLVLCRNLAFTYFDMEQQQEVLQRISGSLVDGGALGIGAHESLPGIAAGFAPWRPNMPIYRKRSK